MNTTEDSFLSNDTVESWGSLICEANRAHWMIALPSVVFMCLLMLIGIPGNVIVLFVYIRQRSRTSVKYFMIILAILDLFACVVIHPYIIMKMFNNFDQQWTLKCKVFEFFVHSTLAVSTFVLTTVALDRYNAICRPLKFAKSSKNAPYHLGFDFVFGIAISFPLLAFYGTRTITVSFKGHNLKGYICDYSDEWDSTMDANVFRSLMLVGFLSVVVTMSILYSRVAYTAYKTIGRVSPSSGTQTENETPNGSSLGRRLAFKQSEQKGSSQQKSSDSGLPSSSVMKNKQINARLFMVTPPQRNRQQPAIMHPTVTKEQLSRKLSTKFKAAKILFLVTAVFFLSWLPFWIIRIGRIIDPSFWTNKDDFQVAFEYFLNRLFYINNAANPIIYTLINQQFRLEVLKYINTLRLKL